MSTASTIKPGLPPMEAKLAGELPADPGWQYEPKWDGFRCLAFRAGDDIEIMSKGGKSLARFFPELIAMLGRLRSEHFVIDGELIIPVGETLAFDALQARLHPAESRIAKLSVETPAQLMLFDCLRSGGLDLIDASLAERRAALETLYAQEDEPSLLLSPRTLDVAAAASWLANSGGALDGVVAKRLDAAYQPGARAMVKVKRHRTADCVIGGFRYDKAGKQVASLLLGLYDEEEKLNHVGFTTALGAEDKSALTRKLEALIEAPGFTGKAPGGPSRWNGGKESEWEPLRAELVAEVRYDQVTGDRFRHATALLRWRPDKAPSQCRIDQLDHPLRPSELKQLLVGI